MEGYNDNWSPWNTEKYKDFTNLDPGRYRLRVQSKNVYEKLGQEATFTFNILSPWYRTPLAYSIYILLFVPAVFLSVRWRFKWKLKKLEQEKEKLERVVKERTQEITRKNAQLSDQAKQLKELDHAKSRFFASISHEFRTPLTLIIGPLEQMLAKELPAEFKDKTHLMFRNASRLLSLINRLLDLSRIDSGKMKLKPVSQDIIAFVKGIISTFEHKALENQLEIRFIHNTPCQFLCFDAERMEDILGNLIANALKFTPPRGLITISIQAVLQPEEDFPRGFLRLSVVDTGSGMPQQELSHIFDLFYQVDETNPTHKGSGIGLALVKELVNLHHGKIDVNSRQGQNSGTEFILRFPLGEDLPNHSGDIPQSEPEETKQTQMVDEEPCSPNPSELNETPPPTHPEYPLGSGGQSRHAAIYPRIHPGVLYGGRS